MTFDWLVTLSPQAQAFWTSVGTSFLAKCGADLAMGLLKAVGGRVARRFQEEPQQKALEEALTEPWAACPWSPAWPTTTSPFLRTMCSDKPCKRGWLCK